MSFQELAYKSGIEEEQLKAIIINKKLDSISTACKIAGGLGIPIIMLFDFCNECDGCSFIEKLP